MPLLNARVVAQAFLPVWSRVPKLISDTGRTACITKSLFLRAPRRFFGSVGQTIGFGRLPCHGQTTKNDGLPHGAAKPCRATNHGQREGKA